MKNSGIYDKEKLTYYISYLFEQKYNKRISSIKLQKSLYFLFAYWAGFNKSINDEEKKENKTKSLKKEEIYLFKNAKFQARRFGPVERDIYKTYKDKIEQIKIEDLKELFIKAEEEINLNGEAKSFVDDLLLNNVFKASDFALVRSSHRDDEWQKVWNLRSNRNKYMKSENIIEEYSKKIL